MKNETTNKKHKRTRVNTRNGPNSKTQSKAQTTQHKKNKHETTQTKQ